VTPISLDIVAPEKSGTDWWGEVKAIFWLVLAVLAFHSFVAKPFYIPTESMMPVLLKGDRLVVSKFPYGWSWVSPSFHVLPPFPGRLFGRLPKRGDIVILTPRGRSDDYIKRLIGLPGDSIELVGGQVYLNDRPLPRAALPPAMIPVDENVDCRPAGYGDFRMVDGAGKAFCRLPRFRETLPDGTSYDVLDLGPSSVDDFPRTVIPPGHVWVMGDNRDQSADSRVSPANNGLGGPVPLDNIGARAEFITFSFDGSTRWLNPLTWVPALRGGRAGNSLRPDVVVPAASESVR